MTQTEGVTSGALTRPMLARSVRATGVNPNSVSYPPSPADGDESTNERLQRRFDNIRGKENLVMRIAVNNYQRIFQPGTEEGWIEITNEREGNKEDVSEVAEAFERRNDDAKDKWERNHPSMRNVSADDVEKAKEGFQRVVSGDADDMDIE